MLRTKCRRLREWVGSLNQIVRRSRTASRTSRCDRLRSELGHEHRVLAAIDDEEAIRRHEGEPRWFRETSGKRPEHDPRLANFADHGSYRSRGDGDLADSVSISIRDEKAIVAIVGQLDREHEPRCIANPVHFTAALRLPPESAVPSPPPPEPAKPPDTMSSSWRSERPPQSNTANPITRSASHRSTFTNRIANRFLVILPVTRTTHHCPTCKDC